MVAHLHYWRRIAKDNLMQTFENPLLQNYLTKFLDIAHKYSLGTGYVQLKFVEMDCTDYPSMDIFEFLDLKDICKFSTDHLKITTLNQ